MQWVKPKSWSRYKKQTHIINCLKAYSYLKKGVPAQQRASKWVHMIWIAFKIKSIAAPKYKSVNDFHSYLCRQRKAAEWKLMGKLYFSTLMALKIFQTHSNSLAAFFYKEVHPHSILKLPTRNTTSFFIVS